MTDGLVFKLEGLHGHLDALDEMSTATRRNVVRRVLLKAGEPVADVASRLAPHERGVLSFSIAVSHRLTRRHAAAMRERASEVEVYVGPAGGQGALYYASHQEFGTILNPASPYMRPAWESTKGAVLMLLTSGLRTEVAKAAARAARKAARR